MNWTQRALCAHVGAIVVCALASAQSVPTEFTYQGSLRLAGEPAAEPVDLQFSLWDAPLGGLQVGGTICRDDVPVSDGRFTVALDFATAFNSAAPRWLEIGVRPAGAVGDCGLGAYTVLAPRQSLTAAPYAMAAQRALSGPQLEADNLWTGDNLFGTPTSLYQWTNSETGTWPTQRIFGQWKLAPVTTTAGIRLVPLVIGGPTTPPTIDTYLFAIKGYCTVNWPDPSWFIRGDGGFETLSHVKISPVNEGSGDSFKFRGPFELAGNQGVSSGMFMIRADVPGAAVQVTGTNDGQGYVFLCGPSELNARWAMENDGTMWWGDAVGLLNVPGKDFSKMPADIGLDVWLRRSGPGRLATNAGLQVGGELQGARLMLSAGRPGPISDDSYLQTDGVAHQPAHGLRMLRTGSVVGGSVQFSVTSMTTPGDVVFQIRVNDQTVFARTVEIEALGPVGTMGSQPRGLDPFLFGDLIQMHVDFTTFEGTIADVSALCEIVHDS